MKEPFSRNEAKKRLLVLVKEGNYVSSLHAEEESKNDGLTSVDVVRALCEGKITEQPEYERGTWRYRVHNDHMVVVIAFAPKSKLKVVTAWRKKK